MIPGDAGLLTPLVPSQPSVKRDPEAQTLWRSCVLSPPLGVLPATYSPHLASAEQPHLQPLIPLQRNFL